MLLNRCGRKLWQNGWKISSSQLGRRGVARDRMLGGILDKCIHYTFADQKDNHKPQRVDTTKKINNDPKEHTEQANNNPPNNNSSTTNIPPTRTPLSH